MIRRIYPTLEAATDVLKSSGYQPMIKPEGGFNYLRWNNGSDEVVVTVLNTTYPCPTQIR